MRNRILLLLACCALVVSCSKDEGGNKRGKRYAAISHLDIAGAEYLYTTGTPNSASASAFARSRSGMELGPQLFKILASGQTNEVIIKDANGEEIPIVDMKIYPVNDDLIFFAYRYDYYDDNDGYAGSDTPAFFVRKSDGAVFAVPEMFWTSFDWHYGNDKYWNSQSNFRLDKRQNLYCSVLKSVYRITTDAAQKSVTATKIADGLAGCSHTRSSVNYNNAHVCGITVDWNGNVIYKNDFDNIYCVTALGAKFKIDNLDVPALFRVSQLLYPFPKSDNGGFLSFYFDDSTMGVELSVCNINEQEQKLEFTSIDDITRYNFTEVLEDKLAVFTDDAIILMRSPTDIKTVSRPASPQNNYDYIANNGLYWHDNNGIYHFDFDAETTKTLHPFDASREYYSFSYTDALIIFYAVDRAQEKRYICEIRAGVYSEKETQGDTGTTPEIIDFIQVR